jgi:ankyrin repeat protein
MIDHGLDINAKDIQGKTPLHLAVMNELNIVKCLVEAGCDVNVIDNEGKSVLHYAVYAHDAEAIIAYLVANRCNRDIADEDGMTAVHHAAFKAPHCIANLITARNVNSIDETGKSALHYLTNAPQAVFHLCVAGVNLHQTNKRG